MDRNALRGEIAKNGFTCARVAQSIGMSPKTFSLKLKKGVFGLDEVERMIQLLSIKDPASIFFNQEVTCKVSSSDNLSTTDLPATQD